MAGPVILEERKAQAPPVVVEHVVEGAVPVADAIPRPADDGERHIARVLRTGAVASGSMFLASVMLEGLPQGHTVSTAIDVLRKAGGSLLLVTPVARLVVAGGLLGLRGEWRYSLYALGVLGLLALAVGAGLAA
jgi:hypothetical protein